MTQLQKIAIKKRASRPSSIREPDLHFRKLVDKLEQAKITMKLEETENLKLQKVNNIQTTTSQINNINDSDTELSEKITKIWNIYEKNPNFKDKPSFKKWCNYCRRTQHCRIQTKTHKITKVNHKNIENPINHFITRPNCALDSSTILCLYVPGFQRQVSKCIPKR